MVFLCTAKRHITSTRSTAVPAALLGQPHAARASVAGVVVSLTRAGWIAPMKEWYAVKGLFRWYFPDTEETDRIEERVVIFKATSFDDALDLAEKEAVVYCKKDPKSNFKIEPCGWWHAYWVGEEPQHGVEIFSRGCKTQLESKPFIRRYYPKSHKAG